MPTQPIDLRSDYLAPPSSVMLDAYRRASGSPLSYGLREDPHQSELESALAELIGMEDALIFPTCTMANLAAIILHTQPGDTVLCPERAHIIGNEGAGGAAYAGVLLQALVGQQLELPVENWVEAVRPREGAAQSNVTLCCLENTNNRLGGGALSVEYSHQWAEALRAATKTKLHMDGSRILHAAAVLGCEPKALAEPFDTISISLNKGLGSPIAAALMGSRRDIAKALRVRQRLGGGLRPTGPACAATLVALSERHVLAHDIRRARGFADQIRSLSQSELHVEPATSNLVFMSLRGTVTSERIARRCADAGLRLSTPAPNRLRAAFHRGVGDDAAVRAGEILIEVLRSETTRD